MSLNIICAKAVSSTWVFGKLELIVAYTAFRSLDIDRSYVKYH